MRQLLFLEMPNEYSGVHILYRKHRISSQTGSSSDIWHRTGPTFEIQDTWPSAIKLRFVEVLNS